MNILRPICILVISFIVGACAPSIRQSITPDQARTIRTIGVISVLNPTGTLGGEQLRKASFDFGTPMTQSIKKALKQLGYAVVPIVYRNRNSSQFLADYSSLPPSRADAVLDTRVIFAGYAQELVPFRVRNHRVYIHLHSRLVSTKTKEVLYSEMVSLIGDKIHVGREVHFAPWKESEPKKYFFRQPVNVVNYPGPLGEHKAKATEGLRAGMGPVARSLTAGLRK